MIANRFRVLSLALIFSGALNIGLVAAFAYFLMGKPHSAKPVSGKKEAAATNSQVFASMSRLTFRELVSYLTNRERVEEGYAKRDLAVASLVAYHHFNLEKALSSLPLQVRNVSLPNGQEISLFPGLTEDQFEAIIRFAYQEKWPLTSKGLFVLLQSEKGARDESLRNAFSLTPEFSALRLLFHKTEAPQEKEELLDLALEGSWNLLENFVSSQGKGADFTPERRRSLLLDYVALRSPAAARILLRTDFSFALKKLEDRTILELLSLISRQTEESSRFCLELLASPRSDPIWQAAAMTLYAYAGEMATVPIDPKEVLARFSPSRQHSSLPKEEPEKISSPPSSRFHIVQSGESLWKIARRYKVKVDEIVALNGLEKDSLFPGMTLKLPQGTGSEPPR